MIGLSNGITPFHVTAAISSNLALLAVMAKVWGINRRDDTGQTALHWAAWKNPDPAVVSRLIALGADVEARDFLGRTALHVAAAFNNVAVIAALLDNGADATARDNLGSEHVTAAISSNLALLAVMAKVWGINRRDDTGQTALHWAAWKNPDPAVVSRLIALGADVEARDFLGRTALHVAAAFNNVAVIAALLDNGADATARDNLGSEPMHKAGALWREVAVVVLLADKGGSIEAKDDFGRTPCDVAQQQEQLHDSIRFVASGR